MAKEETKDKIIVRESQDVFQRFDELDDKVIIAELQNRVVEDWVYHFKQDGKDVWGIGKAGIDGCVSELGKQGIALREEDVSVMPDPTNPQYMLFTAKVSKHFIAKDGAEAMVETAIGTKRQWTKIMARGSDKPVDNKFWFEQGSIKALRNAKSRLIPEDIKAKIIAFAKANKKVQEVKPVVKKEQKKEEEDNDKPATQKTKKEVVETMMKIVNLGEDVSELNERINKYLKANFKIELEHIPGDIPTEKIGRKLLKNLETMLKEKKTENPATADEPPDEPKSDDPGSDDLPF